MSTNATSHQPASNRPAAGEPQSLRLREYRPDSRFDDGVVTAARHLTSELYRHRSHIKMLFRQDFRSNYIGTRLGVFWNVFLPLLPILVYVLLASMRIVPSHEAVAPALAIAFAATLWFLFAGCVQTPLNVVRSRNVESMKTSVPLSASIAASFGRIVFETLVRLVVVVILALVFAAKPALTAPLALLVIAGAVLLFLSLGLLAAIFNVVYPDLQRLIGVFLQYGIFISGVIFPLSAFGPLAFLEWANPFALMIVSAKDLMFSGSVRHPIPLAVLGVGTLIAAGLAVRVFYVMEQRIRGVV